jgi:hypothetical protein
MLKYLDQLNHYQFLRSLIYLPISHLCFSCYVLKHKEAAASDL